MTEKRKVWEFVALSLEGDVAELLISHENEAQNIVISNIRALAAELCDGLDCHEHCVPE